MGIATRFFRLVKADIHSVIDCLEDPESALRQAVREMEESIATREAEIVALDETRERLNQALSRCREKVEEHQKQLELCLAADNDSLARLTMRKKLETDQREQGIIKEIEDLQRIRDIAQRKLEDDKTKLSGVAEKMELFVPLNGARGRAEEGKTTISDDQVEIALLAEKNRLQQKEV